MHLSKNHIYVLFGDNYQLNFHKELSQPGEYAAHEKVTLIHVSEKGERKIENVRVLGPPRENTQVEISKTDAIHLNLNAPLKLSGDHEDSAGIILQGPNGRLYLEKGVIISHRHLHTSHEEAKQLSLTNGQTVSIKIPGLRETILGGVIVRVHHTYRLALHIDCDDGNACFFEPGAEGELIET